MAKKAETKVETKPEPAGRKKGALLDQALTALGKDAAAQALAQKMKELAAAEGLGWEPTAEYVADRLKARDKPTPTTSPARQDYSEPTMTELLEVKKMLDEEGLDKIVAAVERLEKLEALAGGSLKFRAALKFWKNAAGKE